MIELIAQTEGWDFRMGMWLAVITLVAMILALGAIALFAGRDQEEMEGAEHHEE